MPAKPAALSLSDLLGLGRLAADAAHGVTGIVEHMHASILDTPGLAPLARGLTGGVTRLVYGGVRGAFRLTGEGLGNMAALVGPNPDDQPVSRGREIALAVLNGVVGDHLADTGNPLALPMRFRRDGRALTLERQALAEAFPEATGKLAVLLHGLCMSDLQWNRQNHDHGAALARDLGYTPVYLSYNSGLHVSTNGRAFAEALEALVAAWPTKIDDFVIVGHSMGGLVARSACLVAEAEGHAWRGRLNTIVFLGTPHHGAPLERVGNWVDVVIGKTPYAAAFARLGKLRSAGVTDLRYGNLMDEDWQGRDRFARQADPRRPTSLPEGVACYTIVATTAAAPGDLKDLLLGDGLVPVASALGRHKEPARSLDFPPDRQWIACETGHLDLLSRRDVYERLAGWLGQGVASSSPAR
ncbi:PGAP1-like protein [Roseiarcus fermentans]|uniref:PGAP1-like protein n=1 Tax=Roseiarcus fermentans TaxID=1473586 RepID=A0A366F3A2_9HYPH|nr:alpha/beta fold hydrolase [Roseiarcus fermentans]RBP09131.1 PGAP1-like protein [Roseiarcus fermentans]